MFQNLEKEDKEFEDYQYLEEDNQNNKNYRLKNILKKSITFQKILLYVVSFMVSMASFGGSNDITPFGISMFAAILSSGMPVGIIAIVIAIANGISHGLNSTLSYILIALTLILGILIKPPKYIEESNEKRRLGKRVFFSTILVNLAMLLFREFMVYDLLLTIMNAICVLIFYKIFSNSINVIEKIGDGQVYSIEEVMGAGLTYSIAITSLYNFSVFGFNVQNILCILIVLILGWKNGILVGGTAGITVGTVLGIIGTGNVDLVACYALSGMIAGVFSKIGKMGVIVGFIAGNVLLTYVSNGNTIEIIKFQEILIASLGLLAIPKRLKINIEDMYQTPKLLPETTGKVIEENKETILKLEAMSDTISEIARSYKEAAATIVDEEELSKQEKDNYKIFEREIQNNIDEVQDNILFDDISNSANNVLEEIFNNLLNNDVITEKDLIAIFESHNNYIILNGSTKEDLRQMVKVINHSYRVSKLNFIWKKKLQENKKTVSNQLEEVSKAIEGLANNIEKENKSDEKYKSIEDEIKNTLNEIDANVKRVSIKEEKNNKIEIKLYTNTCENVEKPSCNIKKITRTISKIIGQEMIIQTQECGLRLNREECVLKFISKSKQNLQIGIAKTTKEGSIASGDNTLNMYLEDGKYLVALSDGMGSGKEAQKSSKVALGMLEKLLSSGFEKDSSLRLINSTLATINEEDMYATLDIAIYDLYEKNLEFIKNGACPTFVKNRRNVQVLKSISLPTGILTDIDLVEYDKDLKDGDILVMCTDGILDSSKEYTNKELWLKFLLEEIETDDVQKIADIILKEAIDNNYGKPKDDMTVIVTKITENK